MKIEKQLKVIILVLVYSLIAIASKKVKKHKQIFPIVREINPVHSTLEQVIHREPTYSTPSPFGSYRTSQNNSGYETFSSSNTDTRPNTYLRGYKRAEEVKPGVVVHSRRPITVNVETPVDLGTSHQITTITSFDKATGESQTHQITKDVPIEGTRNKVNILIYI
jgi:hypothetical protein